MLGCRASGRSGPHHFSMTELYSSRDSWSPQKRGQSTESQASPIVLDRAWYSYKVWGNSHDSMGCEPSGPIRLVILTGQTNCPNVGYATPFLSHKTWRFVSFVFSPLKEPLCRLLVFHFKTKIAKRTSQQKVLIPHWQENIYEDTMIPNHNSPKSEKPVIESVSLDSRLNPKGEKIHRASGTSQAKPHYQINPKQNRRVLSLLSRVKHDSSHKLKISISSSDGLTPAKGKTKCENQSQIIAQKFPKRLGKVS